MTVITREELEASDGATIIGFIQQETGAEARTVADKLYETISVKDFGAVGDGATDDTDAIADAYASGATAIYWPAGDYLTSDEIDADGVRTIGAARASTTVTATAAMRSVFRLRGGFNSIESLSIESGSELATHCIYVDGPNTNGGAIRNVTAEHAILDIIAFANPEANNNNNFTVENCLIRLGGTTYSTGTAANSAGGTTVTITGGADLTALDPAIRPGVDFLSVGSEWTREISAVLSSNTIQVYPAIAGANSGVAYEIRQGSGIYISRDADNNCIKVLGCNVQNMPVAGIDDHGLYGAISRGNMLQSLGFGRTIGRRNAPGEHTVYNALADNDYYEGCEANVLIGSARDCRIETVVVDDQDAVDGLNAIRVTDFNTFYSGVITCQGRQLGSRKRFTLNATSINAAFGETVVIRHTAASDIVVNLPAPDAASSAGLLFQHFALPITLAINSIGGRKVTVKGGANTVNGVTGTTGVDYHGNYSTITCVYESSSGWTLTPATDTGWIAGTGTANKGAFAAYAGATRSAGYVQAEAQATDDAARNASQRVKAMEDTLRTKGVIN